MAGSFDPAVDLDECQALVWRLSILTEPQPALAPDDLYPNETEPPEDTEPWPFAWDDVAVEAPTPAQWDELTSAPTTAGHAGADATDDMQTELAAAALYRQSMGVLEPTDAQIERMVHRAAAWDDAVAGPERLAAINAMAMQFYADQVDTTWAGPYLDERLPGWRTHPHITAGYAPAGWTTLVDHLGGRGVTDDELLQVGLASRARTGRLIDRFRDRAVLPITHEDQILGFVGRRHPDLTDNDDHAGPKYLNTPDTALFHKGAQLYGAIPALLEQGATPVLVEGPFDALAVTLAGNAQYVGVAPLGTALTDEQARQLATLSTSPIVATDADPAGRAAAERDFWLLAQHGTDPRTTELPAGADPASLLTAAGTTTLRDHLEAAEPLGRALLNARLNQPHTETTLDMAVALIAAQPPQAWLSQANLVCQQLGIDNEQFNQNLVAQVRAWNGNPESAAADALAKGAQQPTPTPAPQADPWVSLADRVDPRLTSEPDWPALANMLDSIHQNGADAQRLVQEAVARGPLDEVPARDLRYRLAALHPAPPPHYEDPEPIHRNADRVEDHLPHTGRDRAPTPRPSR